RFLGLVLWRLLAGQQRVDPANEDFYRLSPGQRVGLPARRYELERGGPGETLRLRRRRTLLHPSVMAARSHAPFGGRDIGPRLPGGRGQKGGRIRQAAPLLLSLKERIVHLPEPDRSLVGHAKGCRGTFRGRGM